MTHFPERVGKVSQIELEFGSLVDQRPTGHHPIQAMVADVAPREFSDMGAEVIALEIEPTFWEKATILHAEYHRPSEKVHPARYARHYADFAALWRHDSKERSAARVDLLHRVRDHKAKFFASSWAHYHTAELGTLRLLPAAARLDELSRDCAAMLPMFMGEPRPFDEVLEIIGEAEQSLNAMKG